MRYELLIFIGILLEDIGDIFGLCEGASWGGDGNKDSFRFHPEGLFESGDNGISPDTISYINTSFG